MLVAVVALLLLAVFLMWALGRVASEADDATEQSARELADERDWDWPHDELKARRARALERFS